VKIDFFLSREDKAIHVLQGLVFLFSGICFAHFYILASSLAFSLAEFLGIVMFVSLSVLAVVHMESGGKIAYICSSPNSALVEWMLKWFLLLYHVR